MDLVLMVSLRRRHFAAALGGGLAMLLLWSVRDTAVPVPQRTAEAPPTSERAPPSSVAAPQGDPSDGLDDAVPTVRGHRLVRILLRMPFGYRGGGIVPTATTGPGWYQALDARVGAWYVPSATANRVATSMTGYAPWADFVVLRSAAAAALRPEGEAQQDDIRRRIDEAAKRWNEPHELEALAALLAPMPQRLRWSRELLDRGRAGEDLPWTVVDVAVTYLTSHNARLDPGDGPRLRWVTRTYPRSRVTVPLAALGRALEQREPVPAADWLQELLASDGDALAEAGVSVRQLHDLRMGVVALGGRPTRTWDDRVAQQVGTCLDRLSPPDVTSTPQASGVWEGGAWTWAANGTAPSGHELASCLSGRSVPRPPEGVVSVQVVLDW